MKKFLSVILSLSLLCLPLFCSCKNGGEDDTSEAVTTYGEYEFPDLSDTVSPFSINGEDVPYSLFRYYYHSVKFRYDQGEETYWDTHEYNEQILKETLMYIRDNYALTEYAKQYNVELTDYEQSQIDSEIDSTRYTYEYDYEYFATLDANFLTPEIYRYTLEISKLYEKVYTYLTTEESGYKISSEESLVYRFLENYISRADHILIINDPGDDVNENETLINRLYEQIKNGADFDTLRKQYSEDENTNSTDIGYYFTQGDIGEEFEAAALALKEGEISEVITAPYGYHIIKRLPHDSAYIKENMTDVFVPLYQEHMMKFAIKKLVDKQEIKYNSSYSSFTVKNVK